MTLRVCARLGAVALAVALALGIAAQPAQAAWVPWQWYDYYNECVADGQAGDGSQWTFWYCTMLSGGYAQLMVWVSVET